MSFPLSVLNTQSHQFEFCIAMFSVCSLITVSFSCYCLCSSQILCGTSGPSTAPQKGKEGADSENLEVRGKMSQKTKVEMKGSSFKKNKTV